MPGHNAEGNQTWNPSVGIYHTPAKDKRESYGGIIAALQDQTVNAGGITRAYPENFAGIIAAIKDLQIAAEQPGVDTGEYPEGGEIIIRPDGTPEWIVIEEPQEGTLWFDTRQGRLFVYANDENDVGDWYQTNGGDGIPILTDDGSPPDIQVAVPGQMWFDKLSNNLYIFAGDYQADDGSINQDGNGGLVWKLLSDMDDDFIQTTGTLPLTLVGPRIKSLENFTYLPDIDLSEGAYTVQKDYNEWILEAVINLDTALEQVDPILIGSDAPLLPKPGQLWYDTTRLELNIWYIDNDSEQWVPTAVSYAYDQTLKSIQSSLTTESAVRAAAVTNVETNVENIRADLQIKITNVLSEVGTLDERLLSTIQELEAKIENRLDTEDYNNLSASIVSRITTLETATPDYNLLLSVDAAAELEQRVTALANTKATPESVTAVQALIPDVSTFTTQADIDTSVSAITNDYLLNTGDEITGTLTLNKFDIATPGIDYSTSASNGTQALKFKTSTPDVSRYTTFGTTDNYWEYAWEFESEEEFCWIYNDTSKVFSINNEGPACSNLFIGDLSTTDLNGRVINNKIDLKERLVTYKEAFEEMRQGVSNATDFDSLKANILTALSNV